MWTAGRSPSGAALPYGLGWFVEEHQGEQLLWHTGLWEGQYSALYLKVPARKLTLILLANSDDIVRVPPGTYQLTHPDGELFLTSRQDGWVRALVP